MKDKRYLLYVIAPYNYSKPRVYQIREDLSCISIGWGGVMGIKQAIYGFWFYNVLFSTRSLLFWLYWISTKTDYKDSSVIVSHNEIESTELRKPETSRKSGLGFDPLRKPTNSPPEKRNNYCNHYRVIRCISLAASIILRNPWWCSLSISSVFLI